MSELVPNLSELVAALPARSDAVTLATAFDTLDLAAARSALRSIVDAWNNPAASPDGSAPPSMPS